MIDLRYGRDVLDALREIPDGVVQCCVTSPPYYGLRDYKTGRWDGGDPGCSHAKADVSNPRLLATSTLQGGKKTTGHQQEGYRDLCRRCGATRVDSQIGLEPTLDEFLGRLVAVFSEVRRVLHPTGVLWVNMGDSYASAWSCNRVNKVGNGAAEQRERFDKTAGGFAEKELMNVPYRLAFALADDGWLHRDTIVWHKPAPMPESVRDRCTKAWEPVFMFTRQPRYFADMEGVKLPPTGRVTFGSSGNKVVANADRPDGSRSDMTPHNGANLRNVWRVASEPYKGAHFATFPSELPRRCLKIGTSPRGCCPTCRAPWVRLTERNVTDARRGVRTQKALQPINNSNGRSYHVAVTATGWQQSCRCPAAEPIPCTVLDPFCGSGTTMRVAAELGLDGLGIDLNYDYLPLARERVGALYLRREESA